MRKELEELFNKAIKDGSINYEEIMEKTTSEEEASDLIYQLSEKNVDIRENDESLYNDSEFDDDEVLENEIDEAESEDEAEEDLDSMDDTSFYGDEEIDYENEDYQDIFNSKSNSNNLYLKVSDPVRMFLKEIGTIKLLSLEEEQQVSKEVYECMHEIDEYNAKVDGGYIPTIEESEHIKSVETRFEMAKQTLTEANLRLVVNIAKHFTNYNMDFSDLIQEGTIGLQKAVIKFDYTKGFKFSTYATGWIKQAITRAIADQSRTIRIPVHMNENINKVNKKEREFMNTYGRKPTIEELSELTGLTPEKIYNVKGTVLKCKQLEDKVGDDEDSTVGDFIPDTQNLNPEEYTAQEALKTEIDELLSNLTDREERVLRLRFGLIDGRIRTLEEVGKEFNVTRERIRQIEAKAIRKLRHPSRSNKLKDFVK